MDLIIVSSIVYINNSAKFSCLAILGNSNCLASINCTFWHWAGCFATFSFTCGQYKLECFILPCSTREILGSFQVHGTLFGVGVRETNYFCLLLALLVAYFCSKRSVSVVCYLYGHGVYAVIICYTRFVRRDHFGYRVGEFFSCILQLIADRGKCYLAFSVICLGLQYFSGFVLQFEAEFSSCRCCSVQCFSCFQSHVSGCCIFRINKLNFSNICGLSIFYFLNFCYRCH